jgi:hypothetical protein
MTGDPTAHVVAVFNHMFALMQQDGQVEQTAAAILTLTVTLVRIHDGFYKTPSKKKKRKEK